MKITELQAYKRLEAMFEQKGYLKGIEDNMPIYSWDNVERVPADVTPGHYVYANRYGKIKFQDIPEKYRTREFFLHALSGVSRDIVEYVKAYPEKFDRQFFKDHIATNYYGLMFELNDFEYMPLEFIDEEMVACAMFNSINMRYVERRGECEEWFYSVYRRKPEVLTQDLYILGARCFAAKRNGKNSFLDITPKEYLTPEYYFALCLENATPVMEDIPESIITDDFIAKLLDDRIENIKCFNEAALEREVTMERKTLITRKITVKIWQCAIIKNFFLIMDIPLNDERIKFFLSIYDEYSFERKFFMENCYEEYLNKKNSTT